jgi:benzoyl-CoA reductase subunit C
MTAEAVLDECRALLERPLGAIAREWKEAHPGGRAIAAYPVWAPVEVIHAAGMLPLALLGGGASVELTHADARFQSFVCSIAKSSLELGFQGLVRGVDGFVFSNICDVARSRPRATCSTSAPSARGPSSSAAAARSRSST